MPQYLKIVGFKDGGTRISIIAFSKAEKMQNNVTLNKRKACQFAGKFSQQGDVLSRSNSPTPAPQGCCKCFRTHGISREMHKAAGQGDLPDLLSLISVI